MDQSLIRITNWYNNGVAAGNYSNAHFGLLSDNDLYYLIGQLHTVYKNSVFKNSADQEIDKILRFLGWNV